MMTQEENYRIKERAGESIKKHGGAEEAITYIKRELKEFEDMWAEYSSDCLGHGITCNRLT